jgi:hypothetical protein
MKNQIKKYFEKEGYSVVSIKKFEKGSSRNTYLVQTKDTKLLLKLFDKSVERKIKTAMMCLQKINAKHELCINPLNKKIIHLENKIGYYYAYFKGMSVDESTIKNKLETFSRLIGRFSKQSLKVGGIKTENKFLKEQTTKARKSLEGLKDSENKEFHPYLELIREGVEKLGEGIYSRGYRKNFFEPIVFPKYGF